MYVDIVLVTYALFLILGGFLGFKKGSKISLWMGLGSGILILGGVWLLTVNPKAAGLFIIGIIVILSLSFISRLIKTRKFMPSGMLLLVTLAVLIFCLKNLT